jgi:hypothetical protein
MELADPVTIPSSPTLLNGIGVNADHLHEPPFCLAKLGVLRALEQLVPYGHE